MRFELEGQSSSKQGEPMNRIKALGQAGQSIWLDFMQRSLVTKGELQKLIETDGICGLTSNPTIFQKAVESSQDYDELFATMARQGKSVAQVYDALTLRDIQDASRIFRPVWEATAHRDGYSSLEVSPKLGPTTPKVPWRRRGVCGRRSGVSNVMIKIPGTPEGVPAIEQCISEGININITLLFSQEAYRSVAEAYLRGLERRVQEGKDVSGLASVASFFVSRIDSEVEKRIGQARAAGVDERRSRLFDGLLGKSPSPTPSSPTECTRGSSVGPGGRRWPRRERAPSAFSGRAPVPRIQNSRTSCTSRSWWGRTPSTPSPRDLGCLSRPRESTAQSHRRPPRRRGHHAQARGGRYLDEGGD